MKYSLGISNFLEEICSLFHSNVFLYFFTLITEEDFIPQWTKKLQMFKLALEKAGEPEIKLPTSTGSPKKQEFQKNIYFCVVDYAKAFDCVDHNKLENSERDGKYQTTWPTSWEICMQVRKQQLELDMEQQTGSK